MAHFQDLSCSSFSVLSPLGEALNIPKSFWEPGSASFYKAHFGTGAIAAPFSAAAVFGPSLTSPLSINTLGAEQLTGIRNVFGSDIKIGSDINLGALKISYSALFSEKNALKDAVVPAWSATAPSFDVKGLKLDFKSPAGDFVGIFRYNGSNICAPCPSDRRAKTNIVNLENCLDKVLKLRGVTFNWNSEVVPLRAKNQDTSVGLIAQEVEEVIPELVILERIEKQDLKTVEYGNLTAVLVEAIKEQQKQIEELKKRIEDLEAQ